MLLPPEESPVQNIQTATPSWSPLPESGFGSALAAFGKVIGAEIDEGLRNEDIAAAQDAEHKFKLRQAQERAAVMSDPAFANRPSEWEREYSRRMDGFVSELQDKTPFHNDAHRAEFSNAVQRAYEMDRGQLVAQGVERAVALGSQLYATQVQDALSIGDHRTAAALVQNAGGHLSPAQQAKFLFDADRMGKVEQMQNDFAANPQAAMALNVTGIARKYNVTTREAAGMLRQREDMVKDYQANNFERMQYAIAEAEVNVNTARPVTRMDVNAALEDGRLNVRQATELQKLLKGSEGYAEHMFSDPKTHNDTAARAREIGKGAITPDSMELAVKEMVMLGRRNYSDKQIADAARYMMNEVERRGDKLAADAISSGGWNAHRDNLAKLPEAEGKLSLEQLITANNITAKTAAIFRADLEQARAAIARGESPTALPANFGMAMTRTLDHVSKDPTLSSGDIVARVAAVIPMDATQRKHLETYADRLKRANADAGEGFKLLAVPETLAALSLSDPAAKNANTAALTECGVSPALAKNIIEAGIKDPTFQQRFLASLPAAPNDVIKTTSAGTVTSADLAASGQSIAAPEVRVDGVRRKLGAFVLSDESGTPLTQERVDELARQNNSKFGMLAEVLKTLDADPANPEAVATIKSLVGDLSFLGISVSRNVLVNVVDTARVTKDLQNTFNKIQGQNTTPRR